MTSAKAKGARTNDGLGDYGLSKKQLAETIGLAPEALYKASRLRAPKTQPRLTETNEILRRVSRLGRRAGAGDGLAPRRADPGLRRTHGGIVGEVRPGRGAARLSRLDRARRLCLRSTGLASRAHDPRRSFKPLTGEGAAVRGGRYNPKGAPALYLALDPMTAVKEAAWD